MKNLEHIQKLLLDPDFRQRIVDLGFDAQLPFELIAEYNSYTKKELELARQMIKSNQLPAEWTREENKPKLWDRIITEVDALDPVDDEQSYATWKVKKNRLFISQFIRYAAVVAGLLIGGYWIYSDIKVKTVATAEKDVVIVKRNPSGQKSKIHLSDGSIVHLNAESEIKYVKGFTNEKREILLNGEAYFEVAKDVDRPFTVISRSVSTTALGTSFNVNSFTKDVHVALVEGSVEVKSMVSDDKLILKPDESVVYKPATGAFEHSTKSVEELAMWRQSILSFDETPLDEVIITLNRWYAVDITCSDTEKQKRLSLSGKFKNQSLDHVLNNIGHSLDFDYVIEGQAVTLKFK
ncbi:FecR domain-containing protein [Reichenbachiella carrageenanivorans]|uniref:FecR domain-containing protein n=1 Tax=Reichenbachiella carrageenanivorans TaxID=2979869 RepID=A0ABY6D1L0_9BACT|nr:FecR domain-containing protein [Reichenbachiella carrageenanivorans]UXX79809.1 FecR domain-containing protein [Reichenbachiella carrageenanivorans]